VDPSRVMVGQQAVVLVDNVPGETSVLLLNRGLFPVYVGGPYVDGPGTGVPLAPLGSLAVSADRQWYAVADPAAQNATQAVYRVPGGTSYSPAPSEIAAQIQASQLAAQIGAAVPVPPSAAAIASGLYTTGVRPVDGPARTAYTAAVPDSGRTVDISQAQSIDIVWDWRIGVARAAGTTRVWAQLRLAWLDDAGSQLQVDSFELCNTNPTTLNAPSTYGAIRIPAIGSKLLISFESTQYGAAPLQANDSAFVGLLLSARPTDRARYFPGSPGNGATPGPGFTGILYNARPVSLAAGATSSPFVLEPYSSGPIDLRLFSSAAPAVATIWFGSGADGAVPYGDQQPLSAGAFTRMQLQGLRSQLFVTFKNTGTVATSVYVHAVASDS